MKKKTRIAIILLFITLIFSACSNNNSSRIEELEQQVSQLEKQLKETEKEIAVSSNTTPTPSSKTVVFTNKFGTPTTVCEHSGCSNYISSTGDTNCCTAHSKKCADCKKYIDEDAYMCIDCLFG